MRHDRIVIDKNKGIVQVTTDDERFYSKIVNGQEVWIPSVTWIADFLPKGVAFYKWLANKGWDESQALMEDGGERGTQVHNAIQMLLRGETVAYNTIVNDRELTTDEYYCVMGFVDWYTKYKPVVEQVEQTVFSPDNRYAGTKDLQCRIGEERWIVDFKTSANIWPSHIIQVSAYKHATSEQVDRLGILQLGYKRNKAGWKFTEVDDKFDLFEAAYTIWQSEMAGVQPLQKDYPLELKIDKEVKHETTGKK